MSLLIKPNLKPSLRETPAIDIDATLKRKLKEDEHDGQQQAAFERLRGNYDELLPRWKGVLLTAVSMITHSQAFLKQRRFSKAHTFSSHFSTGSRAGS